VPWAQAASCVDEIRGCVCVSLYGQHGSNLRPAKRKCTKSSRNLVHLRVLGQFQERSKRWGGRLLQHSESACSTKRSWMLPQQRDGTDTLGAVVPRCCREGPPHVSVDSSRGSQHSLFLPLCVGGLVHMLILNWGCGGISALSLDPSALVLPWSGSSGSHCNTDLAQPWSGLLGRSHFHPP
jgi:hypothetical protein